MIGSGLLAALRRNFGYKLLSLGVAVLLYLIASAQHNPQTTGRVSLQPEIVGLPEAVAVKTGARGLSVTLSGPGELVDAAREKIRATIDGSQARAGTLFLPVRYTLPPEISGLVHYDGPQTAEVTIEDKIERQVPVKVLYDQSAVLPGYEFKTPIVTPERVAVVGLAGDVEKVDQVVALLDNTDSTGAVDREVPVAAQDDRQQEVKSITLRPNRVKVVLALKKVPASKALVLSADLTGAVAPGFQLSGYRFEPALLTVHGEPTLLAGLSSLKVPVDVAGLNASQTRSVVAPLPPGLAVDGARTVRLSLDIRPIVGNAPAPSPTPPDKGVTP